MIFLRFIPFVSLFLFCSAFAQDDNGSINVSERVKYLLDHGNLILKPAEMEEKRLFTGSAAVSPWSDTFWPLRFGSIAMPYRTIPEIRILGALSWKKNYSRYLKISGSVKGNFAELSDDEINDLPPSVKYDYLLGDENLSLSDKIWSNIQDNAYDGGVRGWEGTCHGWSAAAIQVARPTHPVQVIAKNGRKITFFPTDLKALSQYLWANSLAQDFVKMEGKRCRRNHPQMGRSGRVLDEECEGVDPGVWHLVTTHLMGIDRRSFVINRKNNSKVFNQPVASYDFQFFNPATGTTGRADESTIQLENYNDPFYGHRHPESKYIIGVEMNLRYVKEHQINELKESYDSVASDNNESVTYIYDLELNENKEIIGGEWRNRRQGGPLINIGLARAKYPGFLWVIPKDLQAWAVKDFDVKEEWLKDQPIPTSFVQISLDAMNFMYKFFKMDDDGKIMKDDKGELVVDEEVSHPQPLGKIIYRLIDQAK